MFLLIAALAGQVVTADSQVASTLANCALTRRERALSQSTDRRRSREEAGDAMKALTSTGLNIPESDVPMRGCAVVSMQIARSGHVVGFNVIRSEGNFADAVVGQLVQSQRYVHEGHSWKGLAVFVLKDADD